MTRDKRTHRTVPPDEMLGLPLSAVHPLEPTPESTTTETVQHQQTIKKKRGRPSKAEMAMKMKQQQLIIEEDDEAEEEEVYEVEAIKGMRLTTEGIPEYWIKWVGYPEVHNTWQKPEDLNCPEILAEFKKALTDNPSLDMTDKSVEFPPPATRDGWEHLIDSIDGLREIKNDEGVKQIVARVYWKCGFETEELLDNCIEAVPRQLLYFLLSKLKFKSD